MKEIWNQYKLIIIVSIIYLIGILLFMFLPPFNDYSWHPNSNQYSNYGTFIAGLFGTLLALLNSVLIYITFKTQKEQFEKNQKKQEEQHKEALSQQKAQFDEALADEKRRFIITQEHLRDEGLHNDEINKDERKQQQAFFSTERFENRLFELIRTNRTIVSEMEYETPDDYIETNVDSFGKKNIQNVHVKSQKVFVKIQLHFNEAMVECMEIFDEYFQKEKIFKDEQSIIKEEDILKKYYEKYYNRSFLENITKANIIYLCVFYGMGQSGLPILKNAFANVYNEEFTNKIIAQLQKKPVKWDPHWVQYENKNYSKFFTNPSDDLSTKIKFTKYYGGHHHRLGHYFRHLFMLINYVNKESILKYEDRYEYIKYLRCQLSTYEQSIFFLNSISFLGRIWEIQSDLNNKVQSSIDKQLITKYDLIKNVPTGFISNFDLKRYYPLVEFELGMNNSGKDELRKKYS